VLAYVSDSGTNQVGAYKYPAFTLWEPVTQEGQPGCTDAAGDVWFIETNTAELVEYAHGGNIPIETLQDPGNYPVSCAVSPSTGTLAVGNIVTTSDGPGNIALYAHAKGKPRFVLASQRVYFLTYDSGDNLFGDGENSSYAFELFELAHGAKTIQPLTVVGATIEFPGGLQYADNALNVGDQDGAVIYQMHVKGKTAKVVTTTPLTGAVDVVYFDIYKNRVICPDAGAADIKMYAYPQGGMPVRTITGFSEPEAVVISVVSK
jgi:hypothetical protein